MNRLMVLKKCKPYWWGLKGTITLLLAASLAVVPTALISPYCFQVLVDDVMRAGRKELFIVVVAGLLGGYALQLLLGSLQLFCSNRLSNRFTLTLRKDIWKKFCRLPFLALEAKEAGELKLRLMEDVDCIAGFIQEQVAGLLSNVLLAVLSVSLCIYVDPLMTILCLLIVPLVFFVNFLISAGTRRINEKIRVVNERYVSFEHNALQFWREVKAQGAENTFMERFIRYRTILAKYGLVSIRYWMYMEIFRDFKANYLTKVFVYVVGCFFVMKRAMTVGQLVMFGECFAQLFTALDGISGARMSLRMNQPYYKRVFETLEYSEEPEKPVEQLGQTDVAVQHLTFTYPGLARPALQEVELHLPQGDYLAVVGASGCGKTTLAKLLLGLYTPDEGEIRYGGVPLSTIRPEAVFEHVGAVMQDPFLFNMSIRDNLLLANGAASEEALWEACRRADIAAFIQTLPEGLDTTIGESGVKLSGGQKQRLALARILLKDPALLVLDEATSSLDTLAENRIAAALQEAPQGTTVVVIAHRPATVIHARRVLVMRDGRVEDCGTHEELMARSRFYRDMLSGKRGDDTADGG